MAGQVTWNPLYMTIILSILLLFILYESVVRFGRTLLPVGNTSPSFSTKAQDLSLSASSTAGSSITNLRYGPHHIQGHSMGPHLPLHNVEKPCSDCFIVAIQAGLEYENGSTANIDTGTWLHHMILLNEAKRDFLCPKKGERIFASGNERTIGRLNGDGKWGYFVETGDVWTIPMEIMNENEEERVIYFTLTAEWISGMAARDMDYRKATSIWLDVAENSGCHGSKLEAIPGKTSFDSLTWTSTMSGPVFLVGSHMHSGGVSMEVFVNSVHICASWQIYESYHSIDGTIRSHISATEGCGVKFWLEEGDQVFVRANYDSSLHALNIEGGKLDTIMGIVGIYVGQAAIY